MYSHQPARHSAQAIPIALGSRRVFLVAAFLAATAFSGTAQAHPKYISTLAGNGIAGVNGDGLPPLNTALYLPQDGVFGPDGNFYFCDWNNHRIRRIKDGKVETIIGTGELGDALDGVASQIKLNHPTGLCFDHQGRLVLAAWHNSKVKRMDLTTGMIVNIAGTGQRAYGGDAGPANAAKMDLPSSVCADSHDNIWISDQANFRIRKLDAVSGNIDTLAGTGIAGYTGDEGPAIAAQIKSPVGQSAPAGRLEVGPDDKVYFADTGNHVIRMIDAEGKIHTIAGTGVAGFSGDNGPATSAQLNTPSDVAVAADGTIYIADTFNSRIRRVSTTGIISTIAGTGVRGFTGDGGLGTDAKLDRPYGVALALDGESLVIADTHNHRLRILTPAPVEVETPEEVPPVEVIPCTDIVGNICTYAGTGFPAYNGEGRDRQQCDLYWPIDMEFTPSGRTYILDWNNHKVREVQNDGRIVTVIGTDFVGDGPPDLSDQSAPGAPGLTVDLNHPTDLQEFPNGDLLLVAWHNHKFRQLDPVTGLVRIITGGPVGFAGDGGPAKAALVNQPSHGVLDPNGNFLFVDQRNQRLRVVKNFSAQREEGTMITVAGDPGIPPVPGFLDGPAISAKFSFPTGTNPEPTGGVARDANGVYYLSDSNNHRIRRIQFNGPDFTDGQVTTIAGTGTAGYNGDGVAATAQINYPEDIEIGPDGKLYFADTNNHRIRRIDLESGTIETVVGTGVMGYSGDGGPAISAQLNRPFGIAFDKFGNLYVSDSYNSRIRKVKLTTTPEGPAPILPEDYRASFVEVRDCRFSLEHGGVYMRVLTDPAAAPLYQANASQLPQGTVVVKEEYLDSECEPEELVRWRAMRKEAPGFDAADGDWHWQWLTPRREVVYDDKATCITCHLQPDCVGRDYMCTLPGSTGMKVVLDQLPATLVSLSGTPPDDGHSHGNSINFGVYAVGADPHDGRGPFVLEFDHEGPYWIRLETGQSGDLWWISDHLIEGDFYMCGQNGLMLRFTHATQRFEKMTTPGGKTLFGVWGIDKNTLWAVGGDEAGGDTDGVIWKFNGTQWVPDPAAPAPLPTLYKVWGRASDDVYAVGRLGTILHWNGVSWTTVPVPAGFIRPLFTIHGNASRVATVGGAFQGAVLELDGNSFIDKTPGGAPQMNGVFASAGPAIIVGAEGSYATWSGSAWELKDPVVAAKPLDFHGTWMDTAGGMWAVGGDLTVDKSYGVLAYSGQSAITPTFAADHPCGTGAAMGQPGGVSFVRDIAPIFATSGCLASTCHTGAAPASEYDQRTYQNYFGAGQQARNFGMCDIVPGNPEASFLLEKLNPNPRAGVQMPNGFAPLTAAQINLVRTWILQGAVEDTLPSKFFIRGDANSDNNSELTDAINLLGFLYLGDPVQLACAKAGDSDNNGVLEITDAVVLLGFLYLGSPLILPAPYPSCGPDTGTDDLLCNSTQCP